MNLRLQAEADLDFTLEDQDDGFGVTLTLIDDQANNYQLIVQTADVGFFIDPQTGIGVYGRQIEVTVRIKTLTALGGGYPVGGAPGKAWKASYSDTSGKTWTLKVQQNKPDRSLGVYNLLMEAFK